MRINYKIISLLILVTAFVLANIKFQNVKYEPININKVFPKEINNWNGEDLEVEESVAEFLPEDELLFRVYENKLTGSNAVVSIVFSFNRDHLHDPAICYRGQGIEIVKQSVIDLNKNNQINLLNGQKNKQDCYVLYWFSDLNTTFPNSSAFSLHIRKSKFFNKPLKGMVLVVVTSASDDKNELMALANEINDFLVNLRQ